MSAKKSLFSKYIPETVFQISLLIMVFIFYAFDHRCNANDPLVEAGEVAVFINYALAAYLINYVLLPKFLYQKKYIAFTIYVVLLIGVVIVMEEGVLEKIYYPDTRGTKFPGVFFNLTDALPTITILAGFKFAWDALTKQREVEALKVAVKESELQYLKSQINPHFLFNNLNNLYAYALEQSEKTPEIILELSGVLRYMLYECREEYVPLQKEIEQLENFVNLSKLQFEERGIINFNKHNIEPGYQIAPLILTVFIENAFKHSASSQSDNIKIDVDVDLSKSGVLKFSCMNSFSDHSNTTSLSNGIGLKNVKKRLELLYPKSHDLKIDSTKNKFKVLLTLNLSKH